MPEDLKKQALNIVKKRNLCSYMNQTKWNELRNAMLNEMPFPPPFIMKTLFEDTCTDELSFQSDVFNFGDWNEGLAYGGFYYGEFAIEWIKIRPRYLKRRGALVEPELIDESELFEEILTRHNIPFVFQDNVYCIYGYK